MTNPISCIVKKSDRLPRKIPALGEVVRVVDRSGLFVVISTDRERRQVTLIERGGKHWLIDVPFGSLRTLKPRPQPHNPPISRLSRQSERRGADTRAAHAILDSFVLRCPDRE